MKQHSGGITVDAGHREAVANSSRNSTETRPTAEYSDLGQWGSEEWNLPGQGDRGAGCGEWYPESVCETCGEVDMASRICGKRSCPDCWGSWAKEAAVRGTVRVQAFRETQPDNYKRQAAHAMVSPEEGEIRNARQYWKGRSKAAEIAKEKGFRAFCVIPHPYRVTDEGKEKYEREVPRDSEGNPIYGVWVWLRKDVEDMSQYVYWSPHYHIIGITTADMEPAKESDEWAYSFIGSLPRYEGKHDKDSHEGVYGTFRYILSHTGYPENSTKQVITWYGDLANSVFVENATEDWQHEKPSEGVLSVLEREVEEVAGGVEESDERGESGSQTDDMGSCPQDDCEGVLIDVFDVGQYLRQAQPPPDVREKMKLARDWRLGRTEPPPGLKRPQTEEQARESWNAIVGGVNT